MRCGVFQFAVVNISVTGPLPVTAVPSTLSTRIWPSVPMSTCTVPVGCLVSVTQ